MIYDPIFHNYSTGESHKTIVPFYYVFKQVLSESGKFVQISAGLCTFTLIFVKLCDTKVYICIVIVLDFVLFVKPKLG